MFTAKFTKWDFIVENKPVSFTVPGKDLMTVINNVKKQLIKSIKKNDCAAIIDEKGNHIYTLLKIGNDFHIREA